MEFFSQVVGTVILRPYFVAFLCAYFLACTLHLGLKRAFLFALVGYVIAWSAELSSIHNGIPFGYYYYIEETRGRELWLLGVPFMDSMSFVFLSYAGFSMALVATAPVLRKGGIYILETRTIRHSFKVRLLGALLFMYLDIIIDPVALRGDRWFLGLIYGYPNGGSYFGVPISNFAGWFIVGFVLIWALQVIDRFLLKTGTTDIVPSPTWRYLPGPALYVGIILFNLAVALLIGEYTIFWVGVFIFVLPCSLLLAKVREPYF